MTDFFYNKTFFLIITIFLVGGFNLHSFEESNRKEIQFADYLMKQNDYYRAITAYKKSIFFNGSDKIYANYRIAQAYHKSQKFKLSIKNISKVLNDKECDSDYLSKSNLLLGLNYYGLKVYPMALQFLNEDINKDYSQYAYLYKGLIYSESLYWEKASELFMKAADSSEKDSFKKNAKELSEMVLKGNYLNTKSPLLAAGMSTIFPGSGQLYCKHYYDSAMAFMYVASMAYGSFLVYKYDQSQGNSYVNSSIAISITSLFHLGNILGAKKTAEYYNYKQQKIFFKPIRKKVFLFEF